ncbi:MAG: hypothetical protein PHU25_11035 [Deltaproteobacteria bacterium]|nr:hypothetical protein [Deltaproteobacteria bacterium]
MTRTILLVMIVGAALAAGCADNEVTFYVEHMKVQAAPPECTSTTGDAPAHEGYLDLAFGQGFAGWYQVTNKAMVRDQTENLRAETDGIFVEGMEVYVETADGAIVGTSDQNNFFQYALYIEPESSDIVFGNALPETVVRELATQFNCKLLEDYTYDDYMKIVFLGQQSQQVIQQVSEEISSRSFGSVYSVIRFLGHTNGGTEVQTPEYPFMLSLCCNCLIDWGNCMEPCSAFCQEPEQDKMCISGVADGLSPDNKFDCRNLTSSPSQTWPDDTIDGGVGSCATCEAVQ